jgi:hypothetical protein
MTHETASRFAIGMAPAFSLTTLRTLRNEVDALLGLLASDCHSNAFPITAAAI